MIRYGEMTGKHVHIYRFGGEGNDWCFVRTPENYDHTRKQPFPFVICNHGNGWVMDGTPSRANWTKRTMYLPMDDPDYAADPAQYNGTDDSDLWYSNPTIEALLEAGYIVCGCENYADGIFGNEPCRQACAAFYQHMTETYHVEDGCYMIGASNGAQTCINAAFLLGERVKAMVLQYPLTCLINQYMAFLPHRIPIRFAFGLPDVDMTEEQLTELLKAHDLLHVDISNYFPPTKLYYSTTDTNVDCRVNALPMMDYLVANEKVVSGVQVDADGTPREHGDYTHFDPAGCVEWFKQF